MELPRTLTEEDARQALRLSALFGNLPDELVENVSAHAAGRTFDTGEALLEEGVKATELYIIANGHVKIRGRRSPYGCLTLDQEGPGCPIGQLSLLGGHPSTISVVAIEPCVCLALEWEPIWHLAGENPRLGRNLAAVTARTGQYILAELVALSEPDVGKRVERKLRQLAARFGENLPYGAVRINLKLTARELAEWVGASHGSVNDALRLLERREVISRPDDGIVILRRDAP